MKFLFFRSRRIHCPHSNLRGIYGDEINQHGFRLECMTCGRLLDGPVSLANKRSEEVSLSELDYMDRFYDLKKAKVAHFHNRIKAQSIRRRKVSVDCRAVWAYGYLVDAEERIISDACSEHGTNYCHIGNEYSGEVKYIISAEGLCEYTDNFCEVRDSAMPEEVDAIRQTLKQITGKLPQTEPRSYLGLYIC